MTAMRPVPDRCSAGAGGPRADDRGASTRLRSRRSRCSRSSAVTRWPGAGREDHGPMTVIDAAHRDAAKGTVHSSANASGGGVPNGRHPPLGSSGRDDRAACQGPVARPHHRRDTRAERGAPSGRRQRLGEGGALRPDLRARRSDAGPDPTDRPRIRCIAGRGTRARPAGRASAEGGHHRHGLHGLRGRRPPGLRGRPDDGRGGRGRVPRRAGRPARLPWPSPRTRPNG